MVEKSLIQRFSKYSPCKRRKLKPNAIPSKYLSIEEMGMYNKEEKQQPSEFKLLPNKSEVSLTVSPNSLIFFLQK